MKKKLLVFLMVSLSCLPSWLEAQTIKKPLTPAVYDNWKSIDVSTLSNNGRYAAYEVNAQLGDGRLNFVDLQTNKHDSINRAGSALFSPNSNYFVARVKMSYADKRKKKLAKKDKEINDTLGHHGLQYRIKHRLD